MTHPVLEHLSRFRVRWAIAAGVSVVALSLAAFAIGGRGDARDDIDGPRLNIAVVPPVEKSVQPGDVMDVGRLNDGFDGRLPERTEQPAQDVDLYAEQPAYVEDDRNWRADNRREDRRTDSRGYDDRYDSRPAHEDPRRPDGRHQPDTFEGRPMSFGFDRPQPDWRAEREARREALDASERERNAERQRRYRSDGRSSETPAQDSEFY